MELAILITVNLVISFLVYVAFSVRFRMALDKERQNRVPRAFYDNLQMTIQYINTATATVDEKTAVFQRQLRRSEEILKRLEKANVDFEKNLKKSRRKRKTGENPELVVPDSDQLSSDPRERSKTERSKTHPEARNQGYAYSGAYPHAGSGPGSQPGSRRGSEGSAGSDPTEEGGQESRSEHFASWNESDEELSAEGRHMERLLNRMQGDVLQVSEMDDTDDFNASRADFGDHTRQGFPQRTGAPENSQIGGGTRLLARIGGFVGRMMGINSQDFNAMSSEEEAPAKRKTDSAFDREVGRMRRAPGFQSHTGEKRPDTNSHKEPVQPEKGDYFESSSGIASSLNSRKDYYVSGFDPEGDTRLSFSGAREKDGPYRQSASDSELRSNKSVAGSNSRDRVSDVNQARENRAGESGFPPLSEKGPNKTGPYRSGPEAGDEQVSAADQAFVPENEQERRIAKVQEFLESTGLNLLDTTPQTRAVLIRELGSMGFDPPDIIRATRFPPSEVALVLQLPEESGDTRRRTRKIPT